MVEGCRARGGCMTDERDNPGIRVPPPLIYLGALVLGLMLDRSRHVPFLARGVARGLGFSLLGGGAVLNGWFLRTIRKARSATLATPAISPWPRSTPASPQFVTRCGPCSCWRRRFG